MSGTPSWALMAPSVNCTMEWIMLCGCTMASIRSGFNDIYDTIAHTLATTEHVASPDYADYVAVNDQSRRLAAEHIARLEASTSR